MVKVVVIVTVSNCDGYMVVAAVATAQCWWWLPPTAARSAMIMLFGGSIVVVIEGTKLEIKEKTWEKEIKYKYTDRKISLYLHCMNKSLKVYIVANT